MSKIYKSANWAFTHFGDDLSTMVSMLDSMCTDDGPSAYVSLQQETCPKTQKQHLQGFVTLKWQVYTKGFKKLIWNFTELSAVRRDRIVEAIEYTQKEESRTEGGLNLVKGDKLHVIDRNK